MNGGEGVWEIYVESVSLCIWFMSCEGHLFGHYSCPAASLQFHFMAMAIKQEINEREFQMHLLLLSFLSSHLIYSSYFNSKILLREKWRALKQSKCHKKWTITAFIMPTTILWQIMKLDPHTDCLHLKCKTESIHHNSEMQMIINWTTNTYVNILFAFCRISDTNITYFYGDWIFWIEYNEECVNVGNQKNWYLTKNNVHLY